MYGNKYSGSSCFHIRGGSRIFFRRGCTRLLLYFNTNKPLSLIFFLQNTSCIRKPQVISEGGGGGGAHPLHPPPRSALEFLPPRTRAIKAGRINLSALISVQKDSKRGYFTRGKIVIEGQKMTLEYSSPRCYWSIGDLT